MSTESDEKMADAIYDYIEFIICYGEALKPEEIKVETRKGEIVYARQLIMYFSVLFKAGSYSSIGEKLGGKDHATVNHAIKAINNFIDTDKNRRSRIEYYKKLIEKVLFLSKKTVDLKAAMEPLEKEISALEQRCINLTVQVAFLKEKVTAHV